MREDRQRLDKWLWYARFAKTRTLAAKLVTSGFVRVNGQRADNAAKALAVGDVVLGAGAKPRATDDPLRLCPERWLGQATHDDLRKSLDPLLELPVQRVLVSHGEPVLRAGKRALEQLLS